MIVALRKRHIWLWALIGPLLIIGIVIAYTGIPKPKTEKLFLKTSPALPEIVATSQNGQWLASIRSDVGQNQFQLEIVILEPLVSASALVYQTYSKNPADFEKGQMLGSVGKKGTYRFDLPINSKGKKTVNIVLYDDIRSSILSNQTVEL